MPNQDSGRRSLQYLGMITQLGLNIVFPIVLCLFFGNWLHRRFALGQWVVVLFLVLGVAAALNSAVAFLRQGLQDAKRREDEERRD